MSGGFPLPGSLCGAISGDRFSGHTQPLAIASAVSTGVKGAWTQVIATLPSDVDAIIINTQTTTLANAFALFSLDVGIGASGSEVPILGDMPILAENDWSPGTFMVIPCSIPAGSRVSARCSANQFGGFNLFANITFLSGAYEYGAVGGCELIGNSFSIVTSGTANTRGAYAQIAAATTRDYVGILVATAIQTANENAVLFEFATGASGSELVLFQLALKVNNFSSNRGGPSNTGYLPFSIKAGTRIAARTQCDSIDVDTYAAQIVGFF